MSAAIVAGAVIAGGAAIYSSNQNKKAAQSAANAQSQAAASANNTQLQMYNQTRADQEPWRKTGIQNLNTLNGQMPQLTKSFTNADFEQDPGYQFRMDEGLKALQRSASAGGRSQQGGRTMKELMRYGQDYASNEYQNAYNRFSNNQSQTFNKYASLAGVGQTANSQLQQAGQNYANQYGANVTGAANAQAASGIAQTNANNQMIGGLANTGMNTWMQYQMMNRNNGGQ